MSYNGKYKYCRMIFTSNTFTYKDLESSKYPFRPLSHIADVVSGIFTRSSKVFVLDFYKRDSFTFIGYSRCLREKIIIETDVVMSFLRNNADIAFCGLGPEAVERGIILFESKDIDDFNNSIDASFLDSHPYLNDYIKQITPNIIGLRSKEICKSVNILNRKQSEIFAQNKHILAIKDKWCQSFYDEKGNYAIPKEMYGIGMKASILPPKALTAIFNSALFSYLRLHNEFDNSSLRNSRYESILNFPIPTYSLNQTLIVALERIVDSLIWSKKHKEQSMSTNRMERYLYQMLDMMIFELYLPEYVQERNISISDDLQNSILVNNSINTSSDVSEVYSWFMSANNKVRQKLMLLDTRSPELLYPIYTFLIR